MAWLLIDNSNTRTKFALGDADRLLPWRAVLPTVEISPDSLASLLAEIDFDAVMVCSVVPEKAAILEAHFRGKKPLHFLNHQSPLGMGIDYPLPAQIGADRLANAAGVLSRHGVPAVIIDFGTAVTFDVISADPAYCGGVIAPGLEAMTDYLHHRTAKLPKISLLEPPGVIGKSTRHAMLAGAVYGYRGLVREILLKIRASMPRSRKFKVVATGGYAELIAAGLPEIDCVHSKLTLEGLRLIGTRYFTQKSL